MNQQRIAGIATGVLILALSGCATMSENETAGTILGGVAGAVVGNQFGKGSGKTVATAPAAIIGAGAAAEHALDTAAVGETITWMNPANESGQAHGSATITRQGNDNGGRTCREFQQRVTIGGRQVQCYGTACRDENGDWAITS